MLPAGRRLPRRSGAMGRMIWQEFEAAAPQLAGLGLKRFQRDHLALIGTLRADGSPRISPVEPYLVVGHLLLGFEWPTSKGRDLLRDPRCTVHSTVSDPDGQDGEFKLFGRAQAVDSVLANGDYPAWWHGRQPADYRVFSLDIESAAFIAWDLDADEMILHRWTPAVGETETRRPRPG